MTDIIARLTADLRWRLTAAGKGRRPKKKERASWGAFKIPEAAPLLLWGGYMAFAALGTGWGSGQGPLPEWVMFLLFSWPGWIVSFLLLTGATKWLNREAEIRAYSRLLTRNERFTLVEYNKYLRRQIERARSDPALGGAGEVRRLEETQRKLQQLLRGGAGRGVTVESPLSEEAALAEAIVESYEAAGADPLAELDARLPADLKARVEELEREAMGPGSRQREPEG